MCCLCYEAQLLALYRLIKVSELGLPVLRLSCGCVIVNKLSTVCLLPQ